MQFSDTYGCMLTAKFDFSNTGLSGKWSTPQEAYKLSTQRLASVGGAEVAYQFDVVDTRLKVRGTGRVVILRYVSEPGKDFQLIGRVTPFSAETEG